MGTERVTVRQCVEQVCDGREYKGNVEVAGSHFDYELKFNIPIPELGHKKLSDEEDDIRRIFQLTTVREGVEISLTDEEFDLFLAMTVNFAIDFYYSQQIRNTNRGQLGSILKRKETLTSIISAKVSMTRNRTYSFPSNVRDILSSPKFGCSFTA